MQFIGPKRRRASSSVTPSRPRANSARAKRSWSTSGCVIGGILPAVVDCRPGAAEEGPMQVGHMLLTHSKGHDNYFDTVFELAKTSEQLGFDSLWFPDHFMFRNPNRPEQT